MNTVEAQVELLLRLIVYFNVVHSCLFLPVLNFNDLRVYGEAKSDMGGLAVDLDIGGDPVQTVSLPY